MADIAFDPDFAAECAVRAAVIAAIAIGAPTISVETEHMRLFIDLCARHKSTTNQTEPVAVAYRYELANAKDAEGYCGWEWRLSEHRPNVPEGSVRNLTPLFERDHMHRDDGLREALDDLDQARGLIQEAKGSDGPKGGFVTDHLDFAESRLDRVEEALRAALAAIK